MKNIAVKQRERWLIVAAAVALIALAIVVGRSDLFQGRVGGGQGGGGHGGGDTTCAEPVSGPISGPTSGAVSGSEQLPDLFFKSVKYRAPRGKGGNSYHQFEAVIKNGGNRATKPTTVSIDVYFPGPDYSNGQIIPGLSCGGEYTWQVSIPSSAFAENPTSAEWRVDWGGYITESNEANNYSFLSLL